VTKRRKDDEIKIWRDEGRGREIRREEDEIKKIWKGRRTKTKTRKMFPIPTLVSNVIPKCFDPKCRYGYGPKIHNLPA
jgi:hypothetical protein